VAGRWLAVETAERAWAATLSGEGGAVYLQARALARLVRVSVWLVATLWGVGNLYIVYRAIGSVQMPRRVGNLEIVEAVPQRLLLILAIGAGLLFGVGLAWGTGDWWRAAWLATAPPSFGIVDPILNRDVGEYLGRLPWALERQGFLLLATVTAAVLVAFLYVGIGSLRWQGGRLVASAHARVHLGVLLAGLGLALLWGALLDPAEVVAGLHGTVNAGLVAVRGPGGGPLAVAIAAALAALASLGWVVWDRPRWLAFGWSVAVAAQISVYGILPTWSRTRGDEFARDRAELSAVAFGTGRRTVTDAPAYSSMAAFVTAASLWSAPRVAAAVRDSLAEQEAVGGVALLHRPGGMPEWIVAPAPDDSALRQRPELSWEAVHRDQRAAVGTPLAFQEGDSGLVRVPIAVRDTRYWFGEGFTQYAVTPADRDEAAGIALRGGWRRILLAWELQSPELARRTAPGDRLLWRRTASERFQRLAPFASFARPEPVVADGHLWWRAVGYVSGSTFPLVDPAAPNRLRRYHRAGLLGAIHAATGETRFWLLPGADSLSVAWARLFTPLIAPAESLPRPLAATLRYPAQTFDLAVRSVLAAVPDSDGWQPLTREPYELASPVDGTPWLVQGFTSAQGRRLEGFLLGAFGPAGPELQFVAAPTLDEPPQGLVGVGDTVPELPRFWMAGAHLASAQARLIAPRRAVPRPGDVFLTWGNREGHGETRTAALRRLTAAGAPGASDTTIAARWDRAARLFAQLDSALRARDLERFGRIYRQLGDLFAPRRRALAPAAPPQ